MLSLLYQAVHRGEMTKEAAERRLFYARGMRIRLLEDHELQNAAWNVADQLGWPDTFDAEYVALTQLQADALITLVMQPSGGWGVAGPGIRPRTAGGHNDRSQEADPEG